MKQVTLVALYGEKPDELSSLITKCQDEVKSVFEGAFLPYDVRQVHATIVGVERRVGSSNRNLNYWKHRRQQVAMDFDGFLTFLRSSSHIPFEAQIGGFADRDYAFVSDPFETGNDTRPFDRMFSVQGDKVVIMGWPIRGKPLGKKSTSQERVHESRLYPPTLDDIRRAAQNFGILHLYHKTETAIDNDLFFRIGMVDAKKIPSIPASFIKNMRTKLWNTFQTVIAQITRNDIFFAAYEDDKLPLASTEAWPIADERVTGEFVKALYR